MPDPNYPVPLIGSELLIPVPVSFETNEQGTFKLPTLPFRCRLKEVKSAVTKALASTDDGTITVKNGDTSLAVVTIAASAAIGDEDEDTTVDESPFELDEQISIITAKTTAGGKAMLYLVIEILPSHS